MGSDRKGLGRWCYIRLSGKYNRNHWIIVTYRVCNQSSKGLKTAYMQQVRILNRQGKTKPEPQKQWAEDLLRFIKTIPKRDKILVVRDMNRNLEDNELGYFLAETELYDLMIAKHNENTPLTYIQGNKTIDHIIGTMRVLNAVEKIGM
eukprot:1074888-Ditylum_brightwellii.AAC.1